MLGDVWIAGIVAYLAPGAVVTQAVGAVLVCVVTQYTGSLQTGYLTLCGLTSVGIIAGLLSPSSRPSAEAAEVIGLTVAIVRGLTLFYEARWTVQGGRVCRARFATRHRRGNL